MSISPFFVKVESIAVKEIAFWKDEKSVGVKFSAKLRNLLF
jgi:hypothetical protein